MRLPLSVECSDITEMLKVKRQYLGLSQRTLAGQIGMSQRGLVLLEKGERCPNLATLILWARALDCKIELCGR